MEIEDINESEAKPIISLHGLGFLQVQIPGGVRFHAWHPTLPARTCFRHSQIHNHRWSFDSTVLAGTLANEIYDIKDDINGTHIRYSHDSLRQDHGNRGWRGDGMVIINKRDTRAYRQGSKYHMPHAVYHKSIPLTPSVVTMLDKVYIDPTYAACSLCRRDIKPDIDFDRFQLSEARMWEIFHEALARG